MSNSIDIKVFSSAFNSQVGFNESAFLSLIDDTSESVALKILARFQQSLEEGLKAIDKGAEADDSDVIWKACHKLAGSAELLGFQAFSRSSKELSHGLKAAPDVEAHSDEIETYLKMGRDLFKAINVSCPDLSAHL